MMIECATALILGISNNYSAFDSFCRPKSIRWKPELQTLHPTCTPLHPTNTATTPHKHGQCTYTYAQSVQQYSCDSLCTVKQHIIALAIL